MRTNPYHLASIGDLLLRRNQMKNYTFFIPIASAGWRKTMGPKMSGRHFWLSAIPSAKNLSETFLTTRVAP